MATPKLPCAVCPPIEGADSTLTPKLYGSAAAANRFLRSAARPQSPELQEARANAPMIADDWRKRADDYASAGNTEQAKAMLQSLMLSSPPPVLTYNKLGWRRVPLRSRADYSGPPCTLRLRDSLPPRVLEPLFPLDLAAQYQRAEEGRSGVYEVHLTSDWPLKEIEASVDAWLSHGEWQQLASVAEVVIEVGSRIGDAFGKFCPDAPCPAVADFVHSWWIQRYLHDFCNGFSRSEVALRLAGNAFAVEEEVSKAKWFVWRELAELAYKLRTSDEPAPAEPVAPDLATTVGQRIKQLRDKADWSQPDLAREIATNIRTIRGWEHGEHSPGPDKRHTLAEALRKRLNDRSIVGDTFKG